jgi:hypothetical protein
MLGEFPDGRTKCEDLARALNAVFMREHELSLEPLRGLSRKEVVNYVEAIDGLDSYTRARIRLLGLQQHAVPLDEAMWAYARKAQIVDRRCPLEEAQAFLERRVPEGEALEFVALLEKQAWAEMGSAVRNREVARIASVPPDRTARNMLQLVAAGRSTIPPDREVRAATARAGSAAGLATTRKRGQTSRARRSPSKPKRRKTTRRLRASKPTRKVKARSAARRKAKARPKAKRPGKRKATARRATKRRTPPRAKAAKRTRRSPVRSRSR